ncbi:MAG: 50S ribosomal protein L3 [Candidatus Magasanikbacteria bacterium RIFCSPHIGHO2_01_FULL_50_8]|uniref:Large ribosomal subunit protein uL3 n=2 Tax=Candidatus Magasanikiibacteriota TaxID=1752731 RepID=A0A1F6LR48_9BACT|nr:MAG: 50S ribosomal protein L3 [Candidatus Magasanikbacteria bacterium RIFCSPHIGHO2_01_FULL_50_8]OGH68208.1 MAG: 50S ribosomal protein L3 [Candidatus Magasanikbacteria bacterium RIFCSPHIGHO2_02_FULL_50_9b]
MKFILGRKLDMTQVFRADGQVVPVTRIHAGPITVTHIKKQGDAQVAVQVGFENTRSLNKAETGHLKGLPLFRVLKEFQTTQAVNRGDVIAADTFAPGDMVDAIGTSKGRGFAGVVKRHHFRGAPKTHGHKHDLRAPGSIGAGGVQRVFKGMRMAGHMGDERVTVKNLEIVAVDADKNEILVKGAVPGARNSLIVLTTAAGELVVKSVPVVEETPASSSEPEPVEKIEEQVEEVTA